MYYAKGKCEGVKTKVITPKDKTKEPFNQYFLGISEPKKDGFASELNIELFKLTNDQVKAGLNQKIAAMTGKQIAVPFWISRNDSNGRTYLENVLSGEPVLVNDSVARAAA